MFSLWTPDLIYWAPISFRKCYSTQLYFLTEFYYYWIFRWAVFFCLRQDKALTSYIEKYFFVFALFRCDDTIFLIRKRFRFPAYTELSPRNLYYKYSLGWWRQFSCMYLGTQMHAGNSIPNWTSCNKTLRNVHTKIEYCR